MTFSFNQCKSQRYEVSLEAHEMGPEESRPLQSAMAEVWDTVLRQRVVASMGVARSVRGRSVRVTERSARLRAKLGVSVPIPQYLLVLGRWKKWSRPVDSDGEGSSEDEPLIRSVRARVDASEDGSDEDRDLTSFESDSEVESQSCDGSDCGSGPEVDYRGGAGAVLRGGVR